VIIIIYPTYTRALSHRRGRRSTSSFYEVDIHIMVSMLAVMGVAFVGWNVYWNAYGVCLRLKHGPGNYSFGVSVPYLGCCWFDGRRYTCHESQLLPDDVR
jgi:hypothetical protein